MIIKPSQLSALRSSLMNKKIVFAGGTFDLFHRGHIDALKNLRKFGDVIVIAVSSDKRVKQRKGDKRPILSEKERCIIIDSIQYVDYSLVAPESSKNKPFPTLNIIECLKPNFFITTDKKWLLFREKVEHFGTKLKVLPRQSKVNSTTHIIQTIIQRYCIK